MVYHTPVLLHECIEGLNIQPGGTYVDVTFGGGGHSREILKQLGNGRLFAFDQDPDAAGNKIDDERFMLIEQNFKYTKNHLRFQNALPVDGLLADLGVSSHQFDTPERGFTTRFEGKLDMRMNKNAKLTAAGVINTYPEEQLADVFYKYGELKNSRKIASLIAVSRNEEAITTTEQLKAAVEPVTPKFKPQKFHAQLFQALRIEVNGELEALEALLNQCRDIIAIGGRLVVISYHSLEDRLVKNFIKRGNTEGKLKKDFFGNPELPFKAINSKPVTPSEEEIKRNSRARSAKLRIAERVKVKTNE